MPQAQRTKQNLKTRHHQKSHKIVQKVAHQKKAQQQQVQKIRKISQI